jgi:hypothetical protein
MRKRCADIGDKRSDCGARNRDSHVARLFRKRDRADIAIAQQRPVSRMQIEAAAELRHPPSLGHHAAEGDIVIENRAARTLLMHRRCRALEQGERRKAHKVCAGPEAPGGPGIEIDAHTAVATEGFTPGRDTLLGRIGVGGKPGDLQTAQPSPPDRMGLPRSRSNRSPSLTLRYRLCRKSTISNDVIHLADAVTGNPG